MSAEPAAIFKDHRHHQVFFILKVSVQETSKIALCRGKAINAFFGVLPICHQCQNCVCVVGKRMDVSVQSVMITIKGFKSLFQARIQRDELRKIMVIFDGMMLVQLVQKEPGISAKLCAKSRVGPVEVALCAIDKAINKAAKHDMPIQPERRHFTEISVALPHFAWIKIGQNAQMLGQSGADFQRKRAFGIIPLGHSFVACGGGVTGLRFSFASRQVMKLTAAMIMPPPRMT